MLLKKEHRIHAQRIYDYLRQNDNYLISSHINADGDAIAAALSVRLLLERMSKHSVLIFHDQKIDQRFNYLPDFDQILPFQTGLNIKSYLKSAKIENAIIVDVPGYSRLGKTAELLPTKNHVIKIDHHPVEDEMGLMDWVDESASSTTVLVHEIIEISRVHIDQSLAQTIYTGIIYDTGRFSFSNTTSRDLYVCSKMIDLGVQPAEIANRIFFQNSFSALKIIGKGLYSLENYLNQAVNVIYLSYQDMKNNDQSEIEELANYSVAIRGGKVGLFIREVEPGYHKISFRSHSHVDVNRVAKVFEGGGHTRAAGCRIKGSKSDILAKLLKEIQKQL